jgi:tetratricopeptide (TPR) repeat protein
MGYPSEPAIAALFGQANRALKEGRHESASAVARAAASASPGYDTALQLAEVLAAAGATAEARVILAPLAAQGYVAPTVALANVALREGALDEAVDLLERHLRAYPGRGGQVHYVLASVLPHLGRFEEANRHADRGTLITCGDFELTSSRIIHFPSSAASNAQEPVEPFIRRVSHEPYEVADADAVYFIACDSRYFLLFGEALANSLVRRAGARLMFHIHLVNPEPAAEALLERLRANLPLPIACSRENVDLSAFGKRQRRTYLSCARYLVLPTLLERYALPMLVADADQLVVRDLRNLLLELGSHDVGLLRFDDQIANILALISASIVGVNSTPKGLRFVRTLSDTLVGRMLDPVGLSWHLDQAGLAVAHLWHRDVKTLRLRTSIMDSVIDPLASPDSLSSEALFWSITLSHIHSARKLETPLFRQFLESA